MLYVLIALMVLIWSANFIFAKVALQEIPPFSLLFLRLIFSNGLFLGLYLGRSLWRPGIPPGDPSASLRVTPRYSRGDWKWFALLGFFGIACNQIGFTVGLNYTTVGHSSLIICLGPIFVLLLAVRMGLESFTKLKLIGMLLSFGGVAVLALERGFDSHSLTFLGDLLTLGGSAAFALYTVYSKRVAGRYDTLTLNTFTYVFGALVALPLTTWQLFETDWSAVTWKGWLGAIYMAAAASVAAYMIFYYALTKISATRVITFTYFQPVLATLLSVLLLGEKVTGHLIGGGALVLLGVYLAERGRG